MLPSTTVGLETLSIGASLSVMLVVTLLAALFTTIASNPPVPVIAPRVIVKLSAPSTKVSSMVARLKVALLLPARMVTLATPV